MKIKKGSPVRATLLVGLRAGTLLSTWTWGIDPQDPPPAELAEGKGRYETYCGTCHGTSGQGQPDRQSPDEQGIGPAPPHDSAGQTWRHPDEQLLETMARGTSLPVSAMPPFYETVTPPQVAAIMSYLGVSRGQEQLQFPLGVTAAMRERNRWPGTGAASRTFVKKCGVGEKNHRQSRTPRYPGCWYEKAPGPVLALGSAPADGGLVGFRTTNYSKQED